MLLWKLGTVSGCHQLSDRSFYFRGKQFPVCARCTGAFLGYAFGAVLYAFCRFPIWLSVIMCFIMLYDWLFQYFEIKQSNNIRRLLTGILCGAGLVQMYFMFLSCIIKYIKTLL